MNLALKMLDARRSYEFGPDDIRLSMLCTEPILQQIKEKFHFQLAQIGTPAVTVGEVRAALPPGLVFNYGYVVGTEGQPTPIRLLHFEPDRVVVDVAGDSAAIDTVYSALREAVASVRAPDGTPVLGEPHRVVDFTQLLWSPDITPLQLLAPGLQEIVSGQIVGDHPDWVVYPAIRITGAPPTSKVSPEANLATGDALFALELRIGSLPQDNTMMSMATLDTAAHARYLSELVERLGQPEPPGP